MSDQQTPSDEELTATQAIKALGTYNKYFYELRDTHKRIKRHYHGSHKRPYYLRSEIEALARELEVERQATGK